jgi:S1-C subfamily serine protease
MTFRQNLEKIAKIYDGIAILSVEPGTTTHRAGVRSGDVLVEVNGRRVRRLADYALARRRHRELLELVVVRNGKHLRLWAGDAQIASSDEIVEGPAPTCGWRGAA